MAHPRRYREDDPHPLRLRAIALGLPRATEVEARLLRELDARP